MSFDVNASNLNKLALKIDKEKGNNNGKVFDTDEEISVFAEQLEKKGVKGAKNLVTEYILNPMKYEAKFMKQGTSFDEKNSDHQIISYLNDKITTSANSKYIKTYLNKNNEKSKENTNQIIEDIKSSVGWGSGFCWFGWGTDEDKLKEAVKKLDNTNVLDILGANYDKNETLVHAIIDDLSGDDLNEVGKTMIEALVKKADEIGAEITDIISPNVSNDNKITGYTVLNADGVKSGESATTEENLEKVINALKARINDTLSILAGDKDGKKAVQENKETAMMIYAKQADSNLDGEIKGNEVALFKKLCADAGISINQMILAMDKKNEDSYTQEEKTLHNIFNTNIKETISKKAELTTQAAVIASGIKTKNSAKLDETFASINSDNIEDLLQTLENNSEFNNLYRGSTTSGHFVSSDKNDIGNTLIFKLGSDADKYNAIIIATLIDRANKNNIYVDDIASIDGDKIQTRQAVGTTGENALDSKYVDEVITKLRERIKENNTSSNDIELED